MLMYIALDDTSGKVSVDSLLGFTSTLPVYELFSGIWELKAPPRI